MANTTNVFDFVNQTLAQFLAQPAPLTGPSDGTYGNVNTDLKTDEPGFEAPASAIPVAGGQLWSNMVDDFIQAAYPILAAGGGGSIAVKDDGAIVVAVATILNFSGAGETQVSVTESPAGQANIAISSPAPPPSTIAVEKDDTPTVAEAGTFNFKDTARASWSVSEAPPGQANIEVDISPPLITVEDGGTPLAEADTLNFVGTDKTAWVLSEAPSGQVNISLNVAQEINVFGTDYQSKEETDEVNTNSAAWLNVVEIVFTPPSSGVYRGGWSSEVDSNGTYIGLRVRHRSGGGGPWDVLAMGEITAGSLHDPHGGILVDMELDTDLQEFQIDIQSGGPPNSVGARRTRMEVWKVREI